eukprot:m.6721 g.6721  ORF g.6721 m.6721 type:complete len:509 (-) comp5184_c0_seq1:329-1855(-)
MDSMDDRSLLLQADEGKRRVESGSGEVGKGLASPLIYSLLAALGALMFGYTLGYTSPVKDAIMTDLNLPSTQNALFGSLVNVGCMAGAMAGGVVVDLIGRTYTLTLSSVLSVAGFLLISFANAFPMLICGRILGGIAVGFASLTVPVYISEIAPAHLRGGLGSVNQLAVTLGILVCYGIGMNVDWRQLAWIGAIIPGTLFVVSFFLPKSPRWLMQKQRTQQAQNALRRLRSADSDISLEIRQIQIAVAQDAATGTAGFGSLFTGGAGRALVVAVILMLFQQFSGVNSVVFYSGEIFADAGFENANAAALIVSGVQVIVTGISCLIVDKAGRRSLLMAAGIGMVASCAMLGYFFWLSNSHYDAPSTMALVSVILYISCFSLGLGAIPWLMMAELFSPSVRGKAASFATLLNWSCSFLVTETFGKMKEALTEEGVFWFYGCVCAAGTIYVLTLVPETKGRSLEDIVRFFQGDKTAGNQSVDGAGTGGSLVQLASLLAVLYIGVLLFVTSI